MTPDARPPLPDTGVSRVERTGIALVHDGEYIVPDADSAAWIVPAGAGGGGSPDGAAGAAGAEETEVRDVHYYFPVEIEVVGALDQEAMRAVTSRVFEELQRELESRP
jgi:hypothetical protein